MMRILYGVYFRLSKTEAEHSLAEQRSHDLSELLEKSREENAHVMTTHQKELQLEIGVNIVTAMRILQFDTRTVISQPRILI